MKRSLPLLAVLAATLATPLAAQDMSSFLNPSALAAQLGLGNRAVITQLPTTTLRAPLGYTLSTSRVTALNHGAIASLSPEIRSYAPRTSITPVPRGHIARVLTPSADVAPVVTLVAPRAGVADMAELMAEVADAAPAGANTVVISGANTAVISGANTAVIRSSGPAPRLSWWQRIFGD